MFDLSKIVEYLKPELFALVPVLWYLGTVLKKSRLSDWFIPFVLMALSIAMATSYMVIKESPWSISIWTGIIQGVLAAMLADYVFQLKRQVSNQE